MSEFVNVTEVEKLPINDIDSLIAIDADKNIKRTSITVDQELVEDSTNPISSKGVFDALEELRGDVGITIEDVETEIQDLDDDITDLRDELIVVNDQFDDYYTKTEVEAKINEKFDSIEIPEVDLGDYYTKQETYNKTEVDDKFNGYYTNDQVYNKTQIDIKLEDIDQRLGDYATTDYVLNLVGDINIVLDQINGEEV